MLKIIKLLMRPLKFFRLIKQRYFYFVFLNLRFIILKQLLNHEKPKCQQRLYLTGQGKVKLGNNCSFGYSLGGFNKFGTIEIQPRYKKSFYKSNSSISCSCFN